MGQVILSFSALSAVVPAQAGTHNPHAFNLSPAVPQRADTAYGSLCVCDVAGWKRAGDRWVLGLGRPQAGFDPRPPLVTQPEQLTEAAATDLAAQG
jgi:hypothetical protein